MELQEIPSPVPESEPNPEPIPLKTEDMDRIAFELWQRAALEDAAGHASCL